MADNSESFWSFLPAEILVHIFSHLPVKDRTAISFVCHYWALSITVPAVWRFTEIGFEDESPEENHAMMTTFLPFLQCVRSLKIVIDQTRGLNRRSACHVLDLMAQKQCRLLSLSIACCGTCPFFYSGEDILQSIRRLCRNTDMSAMESLDFRQMPLVLDNKMVGLMVGRSPNLHTLLINNRSPGLILLRPETVLDAVRRCRKLSTLGVAYVSLSADVFEELLQPQRGPFKRLHIYYDGMNCDIPDQLWMDMQERHPQFRVGLEFAAVVHARKVAQFMTPYIPVFALRFDNFAFMVDQVRLAARQYSRTLERLELHASASRELNRALVELAQQCVRLQEIHCYCVVSPDVVDAFLQHCPNLKKYTLCLERWMCLNPPVVYLCGYPACLECRKKPSLQ